MRHLVLVALVAAVACGQPAGEVAKTSAAATCRLPVSWSVGQDVRVGFVSLPAGTFTDAGILHPEVPNSSGGTYLASSKRWVRAKRELVSPAGTQVVYVKNDPSNSEVRLFDIATRSSHVAYSGATAFVPVSFQADGIYLQRVINLKQGNVDNLYRLDPAGGVPQLVPGSDRPIAHLLGWSLVADDGAWAGDREDHGCCGYDFYVLRLDLGTGQVTTWLDAQVDKRFYPEGVDTKHRLYVATRGGPMWRIDSPGHKVEVPLTIPQTALGPAFAVDDSQGAWFSDQGGVWLYADGSAAKKFPVATTATVTPAGPCA